MIIKESSAKDLNVNKPNKNEQGAFAKPNKCQQTASLQNQIHANKQQNCKTTSMPTNNLQNQIDANK
jgi:hypothetical protein